ncbi:MAG: hypothetical protein JKX98_08415, partial [Alcanivoracaceae bacterium]|nr:hypothetical protein [Alcanivoracaceae bacterium]
MKSYFFIYKWIISKVYIILALLFPLACQAEMTFENICFGNAVASCYTVADGPITASTPSRFENFIATNGGGVKVLLNSNGGNLWAGLQLGALIRKFEFETVIGSVDSEQRIIDGSCYSSCAYSFLGGVSRSVI